MKKKIFTLLTLMLAVCSGAWAEGEEFSIKFQNSSSVTESSTGYFTYNKGEGTSVSWSSKGKHSCTYGGETYSDVIKMESSTQCYFTTAAKATVTIVQTISNATGDKLKFDGSNLDSNLANTTVTVNSTDKYNEYVITNVAAGKHTITRQSETGLAYVKVVYTGSTLTQLSTPEITFDSTTGEVTIGAVVNSSKVTYTINGSDPTESSTEYTAPFTVEDGVTVKAIAIGDQTSYSNSDIASETVLLDNVAIETPVINQYNGTVAITCATANTIIEYSLDGTTYTAYSRAFTLSEDGTVYARATRSGNYSNVASANVTTIGKGASTKTIWMGHGSFDNNDKNSMTGKSGDDAEGFTLAITGNTSKNWSSGNEKIKINGVERTTIKLSNGAQNTLTFPAGVKATRMTLYSVINSAEARTSYWYEFNGANIANGADVPMGAWNTVSDRLTNPDARVFELTGDKSSVTFTNTGEQLCFIIALDIIEAPVAITPAYDKSTYVTPKALDFTNVSGLKAYVATAASAGKVTLKEVEAAVPAGTPLMLIGTAGTEYTVPVAASAEAPATNMFLAGDGTTTFKGSTYDYILYSDGLFYQIGSGTVATTKAYLHCESDPTAGATSRGLTISFGDEASGISQIENGTKAAENAVYNLSGQRVNQPTKGLYIVNGKKVLVK